MRGYAGRAVAAALLALALGGCSGAPAPQAPALVEPLRAQTPPLYFAGVTFDIPRGTDVGTYAFQLGRCWPYDARLYWGSGALNPVNRAGEWGAAVEGVLADAGLNVLQYRKDIFATLDHTLPNPALVLGGDVVGAHFEVCDHIGWWTGDRLFRESGSGTVKVAWRIFSVTERQVVHRVTTQGRGRVPAGQPYGVSVILERAIAEAAAALAAEPGFRRFLLDNGPASRAAMARAAAARAARTDPRVTIPRLPQHTGALRDRMARVQGAVATVEAGTGHGSGFFVAPGVLLTNAHVVLASRELPVTLADGRRVTATVLRRNVARDVALLHVPAGNPHVLPIRLSPVAPSEEVYALGTPISRELARTLSKGIVSALRENDDGLPVIQADVDIHAGNSGGPLLDAAGNVVGIAYAGYGTDPYSTGLNLFVPIADALDKLNLALAEP